MLPALDRVVRRPLVMLESMGKAERPDGWQFLRGANTKLHHHEGTATALNFDI